jgi:putative hydrolase of the HAD superfamily
MEGAREAIDGVLALGLRAAVVSNSDGRAEEALAASGVRDGHEFVVDSHRVGFEKPNPRIFTIALQRMNIRAPRALYVGDIVCVDVRGARAAGMHVVLIDPYRDYAPGGVATIPHIGALTDWLAEHAATPRPRAATPILEGVTS